VRSQSCVFRFQLFNAILKQRWGWSRHGPGASPPDRRKPVADYASRQGRGVKQPNILCRTQAATGRFFLVLEYVAK
jgi:hypothetical protein